MTALGQFATANDETLATLSHDLRTPVNAIIGLANLLQLSASIPEKEKKYVETLKISADNLLEQINDLADAGHIGSDRSQKNLPTTTQLAEIAREPNLPTLPSALPIEHRNVLLVDDYEPNLVVAEAMLDQLGYDHHIAKDGRDAVIKFLSNKYDLILMDVQMRGLDGFEATRLIRKLEQERGYDYTPIVAVTALVCEQDKQDCLDAGMDDFVPKPFHPSDFAEKLARHISADKRRA